METQDPTKESGAPQCTATSKSSGKRCGKSAIPGGNVCRFHGGAAPQVKKRAEERLAALVDPAIGFLGRALRKKGVSSVQYQAAKDVLDRAGFKPKDVVVVEGDIVAALNRGLARAGKEPVSGQ